MAPLDHHEREKREIQLADEQTAEMMLRHQHEHFEKLVRDAEEEKNRAIQDGHRARRELDDKTQELQRVYESAGNFVQQKDQAIEQALAEAAEWRRLAQERDGTVQLLENRASDMHAHIRNIENHANAQHDARMAMSEETMEMEREQHRRELQAVRSQCGDAQVRIDLLMKAESMMEQRNAQLRAEIRSGVFLRPRRQLSPRTGSYVHNWK
jgi:hypothetical protein